MTEFNEEYVKKLREEAAGWRTKCRELEAQQHNVQVEAELAKRGIQADPGWVSMEEGQSIGEAIDALVARYPSLQTKPADESTDLDLTPEPIKKTTPKPMAPSTPRSTTPKPVRTARINHRNIKEIRKDPVARGKVRELYRDLLRQGSNQGE